MDVAPKNILLRVFNGFDGLGIVLTAALAVTSFWLAPAGPRLLYVIGGVFVIVCMWTTLARLGRVRFRLLSASILDSVLSLEMQDYNRVRRISVPHASIRALLSAPSGRGIKSESLQIMINAKPFLVLFSSRDQPYALLLELERLINSDVPNTQR